MTLEQLQLLQFDDSNFFIILSRLVDGSQIPDGESFYTIQEGEGSLHSRVEMHPSLSKPALSAMESEFLVYKAELIAAEEARLAEIARIAALQARIDIITDHGIIRNRLGLNQPNMALEFKRIIEQNDIVLLEQMEAEWAAYQAELSTQSEVNIMDQLRASRDIALAATDFTQLADAPLSSEEKAQYRTYRQYLRSAPAIYLGGHQIEPIILTFEQWLANPPSYPAGI